MFFGSVLLLALQFFLSESTFIFLSTASALLLLAWTLWYSWHHFHTHGLKPLGSASN
jgi:hypothetical protein